MNLPLLLYPHVTLLRVPSPEFQIFKDYPQWVLGGSQIDAKKYLNMSNKDRWNFNAGHLLDCFPTTAVKRNCRCFLFSWFPKAVGQKTTAGYFSDWSPTTTGTHDRQSYFSIGFRRQPKNKTTDQLVVWWLLDWLANTTRKLMPVVSSIGFQDRRKNHDRQSFVRLPLKDRWEQRPSKTFVFFQT